MMKLHDLLNRGLVAEGATVLRVPDQFGDCFTSISVTIFGKVYILCGLTKTADVCEICDGTAICVYDYQDGVAFIVYKSGKVFVRDIEDEKVMVFEGNLLVYSDSGISYFTEEGENHCLFNDFNRYFIDIDFSHVKSGQVRFTKGDGEVISLSIHQIISQIGRPVRPNLIHI